jgi:protein SCO1/2
MSRDPAPAPPATPPARPRPEVVALAIAALGLGALLAGRAALVGAGTEAPSGEEGDAGPLPVLGEVPAFAFVERSGRPVGREDLLGRIWVADFIFTNCAGVCPRMSMRMAGVHEAIRGDGDAVCVSFTVDPERDTLEVLRDYAPRFSASADGWYFLRGPLAEVHALSYRGFRLGDEKDPLVHSERFVLVDRRGRIRGYYHGVDEEAVARLLRDYRRLRAEP